MVQAGESLGGANCPNFRGGFKTVKKHQKLQKQLGQLAPPKEVRAPSHGPDESVLGFWRLFAHLVPKA